MPSCIDGSLLTSKTSASRVFVKFVGTSKGRWALFNASP